MVVLFGTAFLPLGSPASAGLFCFWRPVPSENSIRLANIVRDPAMILPDDCLLRLDAGLKA